MQIHETPSTLSQLKRYLLYVIPTTSHKASYPKASLTSEVNPFLLVVFNNPYRFTSSSVPDFDIFLASDKYFEPLLRKDSTTHSFIVSVVRNEGPCVLEDCEVASSTDQTTVLGDCTDAFNFVGILDIEGLYAAVVEDVPELDHTF